MRVQYARLQLITAICCFIVATLFTSAVLLAQDRAVDLKPITAEPLTDGRVYLEWETGTEEDTDSFVFIRSLANLTPTYPADIITVVHDGVEKTNVPAFNVPNGATYFAYDENVVAGESYTYVIVEIDLAGTPTVFYDFQVDVTIGDIARAGVDVSPQMASQFGSVGNQVDYTMMVTNTGNRTDLIQLRVQDNSWVAIPSAVFLPLLPGQSQVVTVSVLIPNTATGQCASDTTRIEFESTEVFSSTASAFATLSTRPDGGLFCNFIPLVQR